MKTLRRAAQASGCLSSSRRVTSAPSHVVSAPFPLQVVGASRHLIQTVMQEQVLADNAPWLHVRDRCKVSGLLWSDDGSSVSGAPAAAGARADDGDRRLKPISLLQPLMCSACMPHM